MYLKYTKAAQEVEGAFLISGRSPRPFLAIIILCLLLICAFSLVVSCTSAEMAPDLPSVSDETFPVEIEISPLGSSVICRSGSDADASFVRAASLIRRLDVFIFDDDAIGMLDSWQGFEPAAAGTVSMSSRSGTKRVVVLANVNPNRLTVSETSSYDALCALKVLLTDDDPDYPVMSGESCFTGGRDAIVELGLEPLMSRILLSSVAADFSGTPYEGQSLKDACAYLVNANGSCNVLGRAGFVPELILNSGRLIESDLASLKKVSMLYRKLGNIGRQRTYYMNDFVCYPNDIEEESLGCPFTRFVLQGNIAGQTWYYPVNINQEGFGYSLGAHGIGRNVYHVLDMTVTRTGSTDPDVVVGAGEIATKGWIELHPGNYVTGHDGDTIHIYVDVYPKETMVDISREDLDYDVERGIYEYELDGDGHGVSLMLLKGGTGMFTIDAGPPVNAGFLVIVVCNP